MIKKILKQSPLYSIFLATIRIKQRFAKFVYPMSLRLAGIDKRKPFQKSISDNPIIGDLKVIVSLTSFPARIPFVVKTLYSIMNQSVKPNAIILWLSKLQFPNLEKDLCEELLYLKQFGLSIIWLEDDIRSFKKLIPAIEMFPDDIIITADDDLYYPKYWIKSLLDSYNTNPNVVHTHCSTKILCHNKIISFKGRYGLSGDGSEKYSNKILGGSGTLYPPHILYRDVCNRLLFTKLCPTTDDIWFWAMSLLSNTRIKWIKNNMKTLYYVESSQEESECLTDINDKGERLIDSQTKQVFDYYNLYKYFE